MKSDLRVRFSSGEDVRIKSFVGKVLLLAVIKLNTCHAGWAVELIDEVSRLFEEDDVMALGCCTDFEEGEVIPNFAGRTTPIGWAPRRQVADFLNVSMSGFRVPRYLVVDRDGRVHNYIPSGTTGEEFVTHMRDFVEIFAQKSPSVTKELIQ